MRGPHIMTGVDPTGVPPTRLPDYAQYGDKQHSDRQHSEGHSYLYDDRTTVGSRQDIWPVTPTLGLSRAKHGIRGEGSAARRPLARVVLALVALVSAAGLSVSLQVAG